MKTKFKLPKRILSLVLAFVMVLGMLPMSSFTAFAATTPTAYDGVPVTPTKITSSNYHQFGLTDSNWSTYNGWYGIRNAKELYGFAALVNNNVDRYAKGVLLQDIVVNETVSASGAAYDWEPIGNSSSTSFMGTFDGNGHTISGLYHNLSLPYVGLFGIIGTAVETNSVNIKNVVLANSYIFGFNNIGGIVGRVQGYGATISNCVISEDVTIVKNKENGTPYTGGIIGNYGGLSYVTIQKYKVCCTVRNCVNLGKMQILSADFANGIISNKDYIGSITGAYATDDNAFEFIEVENCYYLSGQMTDMNGSSVEADGDVVNIGLGGTNIRRSNEGCTILTSASASHTCVSVTHREVQATCQYPGLSEYAYCLICEKVTSGTKTATAVVDHKFNTATCLEESICAFCGKKNADKNPNNHVSSETYYEVNSTDKTKHNLKNKCCNNVIATETHQFNTEGICTQCAYVCEHRKTENGICIYCGLTGVSYLYRYYSGDEGKVISSNAIANPVTVITSSTTSMSNGWYVLEEDVTISSRITISGTVNIILTDGCTLTSTQGITTTGATLNIYGQTEGTGTLNVTGAADYNAGIGGTEERNGGTVTINGGIVIAQAGRAAAGIGDGYLASGGTTVVINGGKVTATGGENAAGIGGGCYNYTSSRVTINGGTVKATGGTYGAGIGGGWAFLRPSITGLGATVVINGGSIKATGAGGAGAFGRGFDSAASNGTLKNASGSNVSLKTITLSGASDNALVTEMQGMDSYGITDVRTLDTNKLYFYMSSDVTATSFVADDTEYTHKNGLVYTQHLYTSASCTVPATCQYCGRTEGEAPGHSYVDGVCTVCGIGEDGVHKIYTAEQLVGFAKSVNAGTKDADAILMADIDLTGYAWTTICETGLYYNAYGTDLGYSGTFDGNGHVIKNITVTSSTTRDASCGLFGTVSGTIKNLGIENFTFVDGGYDIRTGAIVGQLITANGNVSNCYVKNATINPGAHVTGGIAGCVYDGTIRNCYVVESTISGSSGRYGYIVGDSRGDNSTTDRPGTVTNCYTDNATIRSNNVGNVTNCATKTKEAFAGGEVTYLLNGSMSNGDLVWYQTIDTDAYPQFSGGTVYAVSETCDESNITSYSNNADDVIPHNFSEAGICSVCGAFEPAKYDIDGVYEISNVGQYMWFAKLVNAGNTDANAKLTADIDMTDYRATYGNVMIGTSSAKYSGTFDGNGKTLTVNLNSTEQYTAPFRYINGATIQNLTVDGTISTNQKFAAGLVACSEGTCKIEKCIVAATISSGVSGDGTHGGLVAHVKSGSMTIDSCGFIGSITGSSTHSCGGFVGWADVATTISNSYVAGTFTTGTSECYTFGRNPGNITVSNSYFKTAYGTNNSGATQKSAEQFASGEVTYLLNGEKSDDSVAWKQTLGTDTYPKLSGGIVYPSTPCPIPAYSNSAVHGHTYSNGYCSACGVIQPIVPVLVDESNYKELNLDKKYIGYYAISTVQELYGFAGLVNGTLEGVEQNGSANAVLLNDITVNANLFDSDGNLVSDTDALNEWIPIGFNVNDSTTIRGYEFKGIFDGRNHTISGLYHNSTEGWHVGLIGCNLGTVCNVTVANSYLKAGARVGGIVGWNEGSIYNCASVNCRISGIDTYQTLVGGIAGISTNGGSIDNCYSTSTVSGKERLGGICGSMQYDSTITNCYNTGAVTGTNEVGGIVGFVWGGEIGNCYNIGAITGNSGTGGIVGWIPNNSENNNSKVENCYFNSDVFTGSGVGSLSRGTATNVEGKTTEQFKSGEVAYLLNLGVNDGTQTWYQDLGTDAAPRFDGGTVYLVKTGTCQELTLSYSNTAGDSYTDHPGYNEDGFCTLCGAPEKPELNTDGYYVIENAGNLFWFAGLVNGTLKDDPAQNVGAKAKLVTDVNISSYEWEPIGVSDAFTGVLDGGGYTLTVNLSGERYMAPIAFAHGATVRNLTVDGTITASGMNAAGIISWIRGGDVVIENCLSSVDIVSSVNGDGTHSGLVGVINGGTLTINNCGFVGSITGDTTYSCGGLVGWAAVTTTIKNSYVAADFTLNTAHGSDSSNTFSRNPGQVRLYNCYYLNELKTTPNTATQMTQAQFESGEVTYKLNSGVTDGTQAWYQAIGTDKYPKLSGETVYPVGNCQNTGYSNVEAEYTDHSFGEKGICSVCGAFEPAKYVDGVYEISNVGQLFWFAEFVNAGNTKANAKLMADIDLKGYNWKPIGTYSDSDTTANAAYSGIFDGNYHVIENLSVKVETAHETGLFGRVNGGGTIKNLGVVNATVENTQGVRAGVIAGEIHNSTVTNVFTAGEITVTTTSAQAGGIAGECAGSVLTNCYTTYGCLTTNAGTVNNCYYMADEANSASKGTNLPKSSFTSGELAYLLNGSTSEGELVWYQTLGADAYPQFIGSVVYYDSVNGYNNHIHNWTYAKDGNKITATCDAADCTNTDGGYVTIAVPGSLIYTGSKIEAVVDNTLTTGDIVTVEYTGNTTEGYPVNIGKYTAKITIDGKEISVTYEIAAASIEGASVSANDAVYTGNAQKPAVTVELGDKTLTEGTDYSVTFPADMTNAGEYTITVTGKGNYAGTASATFTITCDHTHNTNTEYAPVPDTNTHSVICSVCEEVITGEHSGGEATCQTQAVCDICGTSYGDLNPDNHEYVNGVCPCGAIAPTEKNESGVYEIANKYQLVEFAQIVNGTHETIPQDKAANAILMADIDMDGIDWTPICSTGLYYNTTTYTDKGYEGTFDGGGYTISNLKITGTDGVKASYGLFGTLSGTVKNLGMSGMTFSYPGSYNVDTTDARAGAVAGQMLDGSLISDCFVVDSSLTPNNYIVGGIAGCNYAGTIQNCYTKNVTISANSRCGNLVSDTRGDNSTTDRPGTVKNCYTDASRVVGTNTSGSEYITGCVANIPDSIFASGEITYKLNADRTETVWYQKDGMPAFSGSIVYENTCGGDIFYSTTDGDFDSHNIGSDYRCTNCGNYEPATLVTAENYSSLGLDESYVGYYAIENASNLYWYSERERMGDISGSIVLLNDIILDNSKAEWVPIVWEGDCTFDGRGNTITMSLDYGTTQRSENYGLFGTCNCSVIKNLFLDGNIKVNATGHVGAVAGSMYRTTVSNVISYVNVTNTCTTSGSVGGLAGCFGGQHDTARNQYSKIENSAVYANVTGYNAGGLVGEGWGGYQYWDITNAAYFGNVTTNNTTSGTAGAIVGYQNTDNYTSTFTNIYWNKENGLDFYGKRDTENQVYTNTSAKTADQFASGEVTWLLNGESSDGIWKQTLVTEAYPSFTGETVYQITNCKNETAYSNTEESGIHIKQTVTGKAPTCTEPGLTDGVICSVCGETLTAQEEIPATGHTEETVTGKAPTCTESGLTDGVICSVCGEPITAQEEIPATGHTEETVTGKAPTCTESGLTDGVICSVCGTPITAQEEIPATGHTEETVTGKAPTCTESGLTDGVVCSVCGEPITAQEEIPATGIHVDEDNSGRCDTCNCLMQPAKLVMASISLKGNIAINYYMLLSDEVLADSTAYMQFTMADGEIIQIPVSEGIAHERNGETYYVFSCAVNAKEMTDDVVSQFFYEGGSTKEHTYSVKTYADHILANYDDEATKNLITSMLNYGAASQTHFGYNTGSLANAELAAPDYSDVIISGFNATPGQGTELAILYSASLILKSETTLRFFFQVDSSAAFTATYNGQALEVKQRSGLYYVDVVGIAAKDLDEDVTITISDGTNTTDVSFNPMSYCQGVLNDTTGAFDQEMKDLVAALYLYNQAANVYFKES